MAVYLSQPPQARVSIRDYCRDFTGIANEYDGLARAFEAVSGTRKILDLAGGLWRTNTRLVGEGQFAMGGGWITGSIPDTGDSDTNDIIRFTNGPATYSEVTLRDFGLRRFQYANKVGMVIERAVKSRLDNVYFDNFKNGGNTVPLRLAGVQGACLTNCHIAGYGLHGIEGVGYVTATTDIRMDACTISSGLAGNAGTAIYCPLFGTSVGAAGWLMVGGGIENINGHGVELIGARRMRFVGVRFEGIAAGYNWMRITNPEDDPNCLGHLVRDSSMTNTNLTPMIYIGPDVVATRILDNPFPTVGVPLLDEGTGTIGRGNSNLVDS